MSKVCTLTGRKPRNGRTYTKRGIAKYKGGIGLKITGKTSRRFLPNLKRKRVWDPATGTFIKLRLSVAAIRTIDKLGLDLAVYKALKGTL
jgi:large subunit ribosomal protein L28